MQGTVNASHVHILVSLQPRTSNPGCLTDRLLRKAALLHCRVEHGREPAAPRLQCFSTAGQGRSLPMQQITVRVPATTSNLGPGFDSLGIALRIYNSITVAPAASRTQSHPPIVSEAADRFFKQTHRRAFAFSYSTTERIPRCRGLGSSAAVRLGVLMALNCISGSPLDRLTIFELCNELE